ncbi:hypothetical protein ACFOEK_00655 [Litoribrevibacter euphylliae]|uniref:Uncharacterized protein n=1 Tax=Litoribrevibacter euphylliae TaxID=1834034 RepID=A0ABV7HAH8_9GAMM
MEFIFSEEFLLISGGILFVVWGTLGFVFRKVTVDYIEEQMAKEGKEPPLWDKGIGARIGSYAVVIARGKAVNRALVDDYSIIKYTRKKDWYLAVCFLLSLIIFLVVVAVFNFMYGSSE